MDLLLAFLNEGEAMLHLRKCLSQGASEDVFSSIQWRLNDGGEFVLVAKPGLDMNVTDLSAAGSYSGKWIGEFSSLSGGLGNSILLDLAYVLKKLSASRPQQLFVENMFGNRRGEYAILPNLVFQNQRQFHVADQLDLASMFSALSEANTVPFTKGFCTTCFVGGSEKCLTEEWKCIVDELTLVFVTALDGEGFLIWVPADSAIGNVRAKLGLPLYLKDAPDFVLLPFVGPEIELE